MKIQIELTLTPRAKRAAAIIAATSVLMCGGAVAYAQTGATTSDTLIGAALNTLGAAVQTLQVQVAALQAADHVNRATLAASGAVITQNGQWVSRVARPYAGTYVLTFAPGAFAAAPTCVATAIATDLLVPGTTANTSLSAPVVACTLATSTSLTCQGRMERTSGMDTGMSVICSGQ